VILEETTDNKNKRLAGYSQILYLLNITLLPIISFLLLIVLYQKHKANDSPLVIQHFRQSFLANIVAGILLIFVSGLILIFGSLESAYTWMWFILYFLSIHSVLILFGVLAYIKASAGQLYTYPVFGKLWE